MRCRLGLEIDKATEYGTVTGALGAIARRMPPLDVGFAGCIWIRHHQYWHLVGTYNGFNAYNPVHEPARVDDLVWRARHAS